MDERNRQQMILQMIRKEKIVAIVRGIPSGLILDTGRRSCRGKHPGNRTLLSRGDGQAI